MRASWRATGSGRMPRASIDVIPHPRTPPPVIDRAAARAALGIDADTFLVCSFGFVAPNKLTHELLRAWTGSALHQDRHCALVLVGANHDSPYGVEVEALIARAGPGANIRIAGWTDDTVYRQYLQAADAGVQLRTNAHGESSGAVLDCMNYGLATIVNANGSMAEFPPEAVWRLPDAFDVAELGAALETLRRDPARRAALGAGALALLDAHFRPAQCARQYLATLAAARAATQARHAAWRAALAGEDDLPPLAARLAAHEPLCGASCWSTSATGRRRRTRWRRASCAPCWRRPVQACASNPCSSTPAAPRRATARRARPPAACWAWAGARRTRRWSTSTPAISITHRMPPLRPSTAAFDAGLFAAWRARGVERSTYWCGACSDGARRAPPPAPTACCAPRRRLHNELAADFSASATAYNSG